jgi:gamma-tubulin complex component 3
MKKYKLLDHFNALRRYLLLGQGDFIRHLMDLMEEELNKPAHNLLFHNLQRLLDKAIAETNAQYDPTYILSCLDVQLLTTSPNDIGWDVFSLDYRMDGPLKTIFNFDCLARSLRIFNFLWRVKRMEYTTCATWKSHKADMEKFRTMPEIYEIVHQSQITSSEMLRLVQNINFYIMFEVLEVSWKDLCERLNEAKDMDAVIAANEHFLDTIWVQLLLDSKSVDIAKEMRSIFDLIVKMSVLNEAFHDLALNEFVTRKNYTLKCEMLMTEGDSDQLNAIETSEKRRYNQEIRPEIKRAKNQASIIKTSFSDLVRKLLELLKNHHNESLRFLSFRFNFNEYYN